MSAYQWYYTAFSDGQGNVGQTVRGRSQGLRPGMDEQILKLSEYTLPPGTDMFADATHPIVLRYQPLNPTESVLLAIHAYNTPDRRPGNYFIHALVAPPADFTTTPPAAYWESPFWVRRDGNFGADVPPLELGNQPVGLDRTTTVRRFLDEDPARWNQLRSLLSAILSRRRDGGNLVIFAEPATVARWVTAASLLLPPACRPLLTFSTYNFRRDKNEPLRTHITGLLPRPDQRGTLPFGTFILDGNTTTPTTISSPYANYVVDCWQRNDDQALTQLWGQIDDYFSVLTEIDGQLDAALKVKDVFAPNRTPSIFTPDEQRCVTSVLAKVDTQPNLSEGQRADLRQLASNVYKAVVLDPAPQLPDYYTQLMRVGRARQFVTCQEPVELALQMLTSDNASLAMRLLGNAYDVFDSDLFAAEFAKQGLPYITAPDVAEERIRLLWPYAAPLVTPETNPQLLVALYRRCLNEKAMVRPERKALHDLLFDQLLQAPDRWLAVLGANERQRGLPMYTCWYLYEQFASVLQPNEGSLDQCYDQYVLIYPHVKYEQFLKAIENAAKKRQPDDAVATELLSWERKLHRHDPADRAWLAAGLEAAEKVPWDPEHWWKFAIRALEEPTLVRDLDATWRRTLCLAAARGMFRHEYDARERAICQYFPTILMQDAQGSDVAQLLRGIDNLFNQRLDRTGAERIHRELATFSDEEYKQAVKWWMTLAFRVGITSATHGHAVLALAPSVGDPGAGVKQSDDAAQNFVARTPANEARAMMPQQRIAPFWENYWFRFGKFAEAKSIPPLEAAVHFWLDNPKSLPTDLYPLIPRFFYELKDHLAAIRDRQTRESLQRTVATRLYGQQFKSDPNQSRGGSTIKEMQ